MEREHTYLFAGVTLTTLFMENVTEGSSHGGR